MPAAFEAEYRPMRRPARFGSFVLNIGSALLIFATLSLCCGVAFGAASQVMLFRHYLFAECLFYARSDTVQTFFTTLPLLLLSLPARRGHTWLAAVAGVSAALAFQTRLNGGAALLMAIAFLALRDSRDWRALIKILIVVLTFAVVSVAINPFYWAVPRDASGIPEELSLKEPLPLRVIHRVEVQVDDLRVLLDGVEPQWKLNTVVSRVRFTSSVLFSGLAGMAVAGGLIIGLVTMGKMTADQRSIMAWAVTGILVIAVWIPLAWDPDLLMVLPAVVAAASVGYCGGIGCLAERIRSSRKEYVQFEDDVQHLEGGRPGCKRQGVAP